MAITLRYTGTDTSGKTSELTYQEMNDNLKSYYYSSSLQSNTLVLYTTGSVSHSIDLSSYLDNTNTNIYTDNGTLAGARSVLADGNNLTFDFRDAEFKVVSDSGYNIVFENLATGNTAQVLGIDGSGNIRAMTTSSIPGQGGTDTNLYNINGTLTGNRTVTASGSNLTFSFADANFTITSGGGAGGDVYIQDLRQASADSMMVINPGTGLVSWMYTSSLATGGTPGGSDTYVQFNDGGSFGGDSGLVYNKTTNRLTITATGSATRTAPNLLLNSELGNVTVGEVLGVIASNNATDQYSPANYPASIQFTADTNFSPGNYDARIGLFVNNNATETEALRLRSSGQNQLPQYGSGTFSGTVAKYLAVSASGDVLEVDIASGPDLTQPSAVTHTFNGDIVNSANYAWVVELGSGTSAPNSGSMRIGATSPGNKDITTVTAISIHRTSGNSTITSDVLDYLCEEGTLAFRTTGGAGVADTIKIKAVDNSNPSYVIVYVDPSSSSGNISAGTTTTYRLDFQSDAFIPLLDQNYNRIVLNNLASSSPAAVLVPPTTANVGDYYLVEVSAGSSNAGSFAVSYANYITGATTTYNINRQAARYLAGTNTVTPVTLDYSTYGQAAILHLRVHKVAGAAASFALIGADKVLS